MAEWKQRSIRLLCVLTTELPNCSSQGLHSNRTLCLLGTEFHQLQDSHRRRKIPAVILDLLQGLKTSTIYFFNCASTFYEHTGCILNRHLRVSVAQPKPGTCFEWHAANLETLLTTGMHSYWETMDSFRCCSLMFTCKIFEHLK